MGSGIEIQTAHVRQYSNNVQLLLQQQGSLLERAVMTGTHVGSGASPADQVGSVRAEKKTTRHAPTPVMETPQRRRWVLPSQYHVNDYLDVDDMRKLMVDMKGPWAANHALALGRAKDEEIIAAFDATSVTGENQGGTEAFDATNFGQVSGSTGMTIAKLRKAQLQMMVANVQLDREKLFCAMSGQQHDDLLGEIQVTNRDYNGGAPVLQEGRVKYFMGMEFIITELLPLTAAGGDRSCYVFCKSGVHLGIWGSSSRIDERADMSYLWQVYSEGMWGATRVEQGKVCRILCDE